MVLEIGNDEDACELSGDVAYEECGKLLDARVNSRAQCEWLISYSHCVKGENNNEYN